MPMVRGAQAEAPRMVVELHVIGGSSMRRTTRRGQRERREPSPAGFSSSGNPAVIIELDDPFGSLDKNRAALLLSAAKY